MKPLPALILTGIAIFALTRTAQAAAVNSLRYIINRVKLGWQGLTPLLTFDFSIQNPSNESFTVSSVVGDVYLNGQYIGNISKFEEKKIAAATQTSYSADVRLSAAELASYIVNVFSGTQKLDATVRVKGYLNVEKTILPIDISYRLV